MKTVILFVLVWGAQILAGFREHRRANTPRRNPFSGELKGQEKWRVKRAILRKLTGI